MTIPPKRPLYASVSRQNNPFDPYAIRNMQRQLCRTDIYALAKVLGYPDISAAVHGPIVEILPKLYGGQDIEVSPGVFEYKPYKEIWQMPGNREFLILYPRGHLKTTLVSQTYLVQCIINWPDIRIMLSCGTGDQVERVIRAVKGIFQYNEDFRILFPEFCPDNVDDFGSSQQFIVPARKLQRGEPTVFSVTVGKTISGYHPDIIFHSDLVDKTNVKTPGGITDVKNHFIYMQPLLERYSAKDGYPATRGFTFVEGTPYDFGDLHNELIDNDQCFNCGSKKSDHVGKHKCKDYKPLWVKVIKPAQEDYPYGKILWEDRFPPESLEQIRVSMDDWHFSSQYLMKCVPQGDGLCDPRDVLFIPRKHLGAIIPTLRLHVTIDLAGMEESSRTDFTVLTLGGFDHDGRLYIIEIHCGHYSPEQVIDIIFDLHNRWPTIIDYKIEKDAHARVLLPFLQRENSKRGSLTGKWLPAFIPIKRDTRVTKQERIKGLRPWFKATPPVIRFNDNIPIGSKQELLSEIAKFPSQSYGIHDDILDTLADLMQNSEGTVTSDVIADPPDMKFALFGKRPPRDRFMGFNEEGIAEWLYGPDPGGSKKESKTGFLN